MPLWMLNATTTTISTIVTGNRCILSPKMYCIPEVHVDITVADALYTTINTAVHFKKLEGNTRDEGNTKPDLAALEVVGQCNRVCCLSLLYYKSGIFCQKAAIMMLLFQFNTSPNLFLSMKYRIRIFQGYEYYWSVYEAQIRVRVHTKNNIWNIVLIWAGNSPVFARPQFCRLSWIRVTAVELYAINNFENYFDGMDSANCL